MDKYIVDRYELGSRIGNCFISSAQDPYQLADDILAGIEPVKPLSRIEVESIINGVIEAVYKKRLIDPVRRKATNAIINLTPKKIDTLCKEANK